MGTAFEAKVGENASRRLSTLLFPTKFTTFAGVFLKTNPMILHVTDIDGQKRSIEVSPNPSGNLMEALVDENFEVAAICGGMAGCGTCHIQILKGPADLDSPEEDEAFMLESLANLTEQSRLSCQLPLIKEWDGMEIVVLGDGM